MTNALRHRVHAGDIQERLETTWAIWSRKKPAVEALAEQCELLISLDTFILRHIHCDSLQNNFSKRRVLAP